MENLSSKKILIDTNFLIALDNQESQYHQNAKEYSKRFIDNKNTLYLSSIVMFEFLLNSRNPKWQDGVREFRKLDFTFLDSQKLLLFRDKRNYRDLKKEDKICAKDDDKIIAQCIHNRIDALITGDKELINFIQHKIRNIQIGSNQNQESYTLKCIDFKKPLNNQQLEL